MSLLALLTAMSCTSPQDSAEPLPTLAPPAPGEGFQVSLTTHAEPYSEIWDCAVFDIPTDELAPVNWVKYLQNDGLHHVTLSTLGFNTAGTMEPGMYDCNDLYADPVFMEDAVMIFGNQGEGEGEMHLPEGVAAQLPPTLALVYEVHYVNASPDPVDVYSYLNAYTIPDSEVESGIWGGSVRDEHINLPGNAVGYSEWSRCVMNTDVEVLFLASHTHELGVKFEIAHWDGETVGETFYSNDDWHDPKIVQYEPPMVLPQGQGFQFTCTWDNPNPDPVTYGLTSTDEMCNLAIVHTPFDMNALCEVVETSDGVLYTP